MQERITQAGLRKSIEAFSYNNAGAHNSVYRGKDLGTSFTEEQSASIRDGSFKDLYIGDYWTINNTVYRIADCDYYYHTGNPECTNHHIVIVPDKVMDTKKMNDTDVTGGAYVGSKMYTTYMNNTKNKIINDFGSSHILSHKAYLPNATSNGKPSGASWYDSQIELMTERMVYGSNIFGSVCDGSNTIPYIYTLDYKQLNLFRYRPDLIGTGMGNSSGSYWLRDVVSGNYFSFVYWAGTCDYRGASTEYGVRPAFTVY